ncbi:MAG: CPBP family intramembrane metalloprotease [Nitrospirae bacterium]|nr:MAG: CPBP family intramembrane metalloprotease [Nitrospirota bacterium]
MPIQPGLSSHPAISHLQNTAGERFAWLALLPVLSTGLYYALPLRLQAESVVQFLPQTLAYLGLIIWAGYNQNPGSRLGLAPRQIGQGLRWGLVTGLLLGGLNVSVILYLVPLLGGDIAFLRQTPHAQAPTLLMLPWFIFFIAVFVELTFRGFLLGRLMAFIPTRPQQSEAPGAALAISISALTFSFDPFMVATFKHLHWIAVWDGLVWGIIWVRLRNLYATIVAHAIEVIVMYSVLKAALE